MQEILLIGFYQPDEPLTRFLEAAQQEFNLPVRSGVCAHVLRGCRGVVPGILSSREWVEWASARGHPHTLGGFLFGHP